MQRKIHNSVIFPQKLYSNSKEFQEIHDRLHPEEIKEIVKSYDRPYPDETFIYSVNQKRLLFIFICK